MAANQRTAMGKTERKHVTIDGVRYKNIRLRAARPRNAFKSFYRTVPPKGKKASHLSALPCGADKSDYDARKLSDSHYER